MLVDVTSGVIIALTLTGLYLWAVPILHKRQSKARQAATPLIARAPKLREALPAMPAAATAEMAETAST